MRQIALACLAGLLLLSSVVAQPTQSAKDHFDKAVAYMKERKFDLALNELNLVIQINPRFAPAYGLRGNLRFVKQEFDLALDDYNKIIELAPNIPGIHQIYNNRGVIMALKGDIPAAIRDFDRAIAIKPDYAEAYSSRGFQKQDAGNLNEALADFNKAISLNPATSGAYEGRGIIRTYGGDLIGALADFNKSIELNPSNIAAYADRASLEFKKGDLDAALADFNKVLELMPTHTEAQLERGLVRLLKGQVTEGLADLKNSFAADPAAFDRTRKPPYVNPAFELDQFINANLRNPRGYEARGIVRLIQGKAEEAEKDFQKTLSLNRALKAEIEMLKTKVSK